MRIRTLFAVLLAVWGSGTPQVLRADEPARVVEVEQSALGPLRLRLHRPGQAAFRAFILADPTRLVVDVATPVMETDGIEWPVTVRSAEAGALDARWSRLVLQLSRPMILEHMVPRGEFLTLVLATASEAGTRQAARLAPGADVLTRPTGSLRRVTDRPLVVIDPGHGGVDPGAKRAGVAEKDITLAVARALKRALLAAGQVDVLLTRDRDRLVLLDDRVAIGRAADAALFVSLHVNTVEVGTARGASLHVPSQEASDPESAALAVLENRSDSLAGVEEVATEDDVALALLDMMRPATHARARALAKDLVAQLRLNRIDVHRRPLKAADFRVLRAPDMPSVLVELGFLSNPEERARMTSPEWQERVADALKAGIDAWITADATFLSLMQQ